MLKLLWIRYWKPEKSYVSNVRFPSNYSVSTIVLPNHYHLLVQCRPLSVISRPLRKVHARTARELNRRAGLTGRKIWHLFSDRHIRNERHYYTTLNYIHYNPTKHDYVLKPSDWTCSSFHWYEKHFGIEWLRDLWRTYPIRDYGKGWDWLSQWCPWRIKNWTGNELPYYELTQRAMNCPTTNQPPFVVVRFIARCAKACQRILP